MGTHVRIKDFKIKKIKNEKKKEYIGISSNEVDETGAYYTE